MSQISTKFIKANAVTNSTLAQMVAHTLKGNNTGSTANAADLTVSQVQTLLGISTNSLLIAPAFQSFTSSGTYNPTYAFSVSSANATIGATYTDSNLHTYTVSQTISSGTLLYATSGNAPASSGTLTKVTGTGDSTITYSSVRAPLYAEIEIKGAGGGGAGSSQGNGGSGVTGGGNSTFGSILTANGGGAGITVAGATSNGGTGGSGTISSGATGEITMGQGGQAGSSAATAAINLAGGVGGGAGGGHSNTASQGGSGTNGGGGAGGGTSGTGTQLTSGGGGGEGGRINAIYPNPASQSISIGAGGTGGTAGTNGSNGGTGGNGYLTAVDHFQ